MKTRIITLFLAACLLIEVGILKSEDCAFEYAVCTIQSPNVCRVRETSLPKLTNKTCNLGFKWIWTDEKCGKTNAGNPCGGYLGDGGLCSSN